MHWSDEAEEILAGDHVVILAYATPAKGVVLLPVTNFAVRDRAAGTLTAVSTSVGVWRKLERIRRDPHVALAYHTRAHADTNRPEYVLVQGEATLSEPIEDYPTTILEHWERIEPDWSTRNAMWKRWQRVYGLRIAIEIDVERVVTWPDLECRGEPDVQGAPWPEPPAPQRAPGKGTGPRIDQGRAAQRATRLPHLLLGWIGADGFPVVVPVEVVGTDERGILLRPPPGAVPPGGRRAGLTAHTFNRGMIGQHQRKHTGWLEATADDAVVVYAPHTDNSYRFPPNKTLFRLIGGAATRRGLRGARRAGFA